MKHLQIIDEETGEALEELGVRTRVRTRACSECRFRIKDSLVRDFDKCGARGNKELKANGLNPDGDCVLWESSDKAIARRQVTTITKTHPLVKLWAWTSLLAILWLLLRGIL